MKNIFSGTYKQVEETVSKDFAEESIDTSHRFRTFKMLVYIIFFVGGPYAIFGASYYIGNHMDEAIAPLDKNNEYISLFSKIWFTHLVSALYFIAAALGRFYSGKQNAKGFFLFNSIQTLSLFLFIMFIFKFSQLFIFSFILRTIYGVLFTVTSMFVLIRSYKSAENMIFTEARNRHPIVDKIIRKMKGLMGILILVGGPFYFLKTISETVGNLETKLWGAFSQFFPLLIVLIMFLFLYLLDTVIRSYYLNKYSEEFRQKFGIEKAVWYGLKPFPKENEAEARAEDIQ